MKISIITVFPELHTTFLATSIVGRACERNLVTVRTLRLADFCAPKERIDEPVVGPGAGMIIKPEVIERAISACENDWGHGYKIFFSPQGTRLTQRYLQTMAAQILNSSADGLEPSPRLRPTGETADISSQVSPHLILICSRYEGIDARVEQHYADAIISIGDYVVTGGDIPAQIFLEGLLRLLPGVVGKQESVTEESFSRALLDYPEYGLPVEWKGMRIPEIVQSGNHAAIKKWRTQQALRTTLSRRFDWFASSQPTPEECASALQTIPPHYVALMHTQVKLKDGTVGTTSITSIDLHDTARSCATYGIKNFFMVTPLVDQQAIIATFLDFWRSDFGKNYNQSRYHAVSKVQPALNFDEVISAITTLEGKTPLVIATSAKEYAHVSKIDFTQQGTVWQHDRPVLLLFGTGQGLDDALIEKCDYLLTPVSGMTAYNHLSVRSAIAIVLDRWLGLHQQNN
ncbi:MAG: RNA methyltransferase [Candidatus Babeliales bacterium]|jgi:tRNA (guanine37-N1)-methyltransferase